MSCEKMGIKNSCRINIAFLVSFILLISLGTWQLCRLEWKNKIIAEISAKQDLPTQHLKSLKQIEQYEFRKVAIEGTLLWEKKIFLYSGGRSAEPGYMVLVPMKVGDQYIMVNLGSIKEQQRTVMQALIGEKRFVINGIVRNKEIQNRFVPNNDLNKNMWFWIDISSMEKFTNLALSNYYITAINQVIEVIIPNKPFKSFNIRNDHLQYAITWYGLAISLVVIFYRYKSKESNL